MIRLLEVCYRLDRVSSMFYFFKKSEYQISSAHYMSVYPETFFSSNKMILFDYFLRKPFATIYDHLSYAKENLFLF